MTKIFCMVNFISQGGYHMIFIYGTLMSFMKKDDISSCFFHFFKTLMLWVGRVGGWEEGDVKGQKMVQNEKEFCLSCSISRKSYTLWFLFMALMFEMIIPQEVSSIFFKMLISQVVTGVKRTNNSLKWQNTLSVGLDISGTIRHLIIICGTLV